MAWALAWFMSGAVSYLLSQPFLVRVGILSPEMQIGLWFGATIVIVGIVSAKFFTWRPTEQAVALLAAIDISWLLMRTSSS